MYVYVVLQFSLFLISGLILSLLPANERRCNFETTSLICWVQAKNQPCGIQFLTNGDVRYKNDSKVEFLLVHLSLCKRDDLGVWIWVWISIIITITIVRIRFAEVQHTTLKFATKSGHIFYGMVLLTITCKSPPPPPPPPPPHTHTHNYTHY